MFLNRFFFARYIKKVKYLYVKIKAEKYFHALELLIYFNGKYCKGIDF